MECHNRVGYSLFGLCVAVYLRILLCQFLGQCLQNGSHVSLSSKQSSPRKRDFSFKKNIIFTIFKNTKKKFEKLNIQKMERKKPESSEKVVYE